MQKSHAQRSLYTKMLSVTTSIQLQYNLYIFLSYPNNITPPSRGLGVADLGVKAEGGDARRVLDGREVRRAGDAARPDADGGAGEGGGNVRGVRCTWAAEGKSAEDEQTIFNAMKSFTLETNHAL